VLGVWLSLLAYRESESNLIFIPLILIGASFAYYVITFIAKGGNVNYYFTPHTPNENEKILNKLIEKNRSKLLMTICALSLTIAEISMAVTKIDNKTVNFDGLFGSFIMSIITVGLVCEGTKFLSAWWNIKRKSLQAP
jgi:hypothetical protein